MEITTKKYSVKYDIETNTIYWEGVLRLDGFHEYEPITELLNQVTALEPVLITLNIRKLKALNSSGISVLGRFIFNIDKKQTTQLVVMQTSKKIVWQKKWAKNFLLLVPSLQFEWE